MNRRYRKGAFFLPLLYIAVIVGLVFLQFSGSTVFTENLEDITISGIWDLSRDIENPPISSLIVEYKGLQFAFNEDSPLRLREGGAAASSASSPGANSSTADSNGAPSNSAADSDNDLRFTLNEYTISGNEVTLRFDRSVFMRFVYDANNISVAFSLPPQLAQRGDLIIPFVLSTGSRYEATDNSFTHYISKGRNEFILLLPQESTIDFDQSTIRLSSNEIARGIQFTRRAAGNQDLAFEWSENNVEAISAEQYADVIRNYIDNAYLAWRSNRYNANAGTWLMGNDESQFSEDILINLLSEAWLRNEYTRVSADMRSAASLHLDRIGHRSSVFLGDLRRVINNFDEEERLRNIQITNLINLRDTALFLREDLSQYILSSPNNDLLAFIESIDAETLSDFDILGISMNYYLFSLPGEGIRQALAPFTGLIEERILPSIVYVNEGFFFQTQPGNVDSYYSLIAGLVLIQHGQDRGNEQLTLLGRNIVLSMLGRSDLLGLMPSFIEITAGRISAEQGTLPPEALYKFLHSNPHYPQYIDLAEYFGNGAWGYASLPNFQTSRTQSEFTLSFNHDPSRTHYLFFRGIPSIDPLSGMELFGIIWRNAPDFEIYAKGRFYNPENNTLMIKFSDEEVQQDIVIFY